MDKAYEAKLQVQKRNQLTGCWEIIKEFQTIRPLKRKKLLWFFYNSTDYFSWLKNHQDTRIKAVSFAKEIFSEKHNDVRIYGTANVGCTFWNICWLNGRWYDDPKEPIAFE